MSTSSSTEIRLPPIYRDFLPLLANDVRDRQSRVDTFQLLLNWELPVNNAEFVCDLIYGGSEPTRSLAELCVAFGSAPQMLAVAVSCGQSIVDWNYLREAFDEYFSPTPCNLSLTVDVQQSHGSTEIDVDPFTGTVLTHINTVLADIGWNSIKIQRMYRGHWGRYLNAIQKQPRLRADQPFLERLFQFDPTTIALLNFDACQQLSADQYRNMLAAAIGPRFGV